MSSSVSDLRTVCFCPFCGTREEKNEQEIYQPVEWESLDRLCAFCQKQRFRRHDRKNYLLLDFRGVFGYYLNVLYPDKIYYSTVRDLLNRHVAAGLAHPALIYNNKNLLWYIDFRRVGDRKGQFLFKGVLETVNKIIDELDILRYGSGIDIGKFRLKYQTALQKFHDFRERPEGKQILSPTFAGCTKAKIDYDWSSQKNINWFADLCYASLTRTIKSKPQNLVPATDGDTKNAYLQHQYHFEDQKAYYTGVISINPTLGIPVCDEKFNLRFEDRKTLFQRARFICMQLGYQLVLQDFQLE